MNLVWKLLRQHISIPQFAGFFFANFVGMLIILLGIQFYTDIQSVYSSEDSFMKEDYLIINKDVSTLGTLAGSSSTFSQSEIDDLREQPFAERVGMFTASAYDVRATFDVEGFVRFSTDMFFESVPDDFVDVKTADWTFAEGDTKIPIILPRNYLDLYNFGFAQSRNMPQLSEGILGAMKLGVTVSGAGRYDVFEGRIVGFSNRLNTILVPQQFMDWANRTYATGAAREYTRVIVQVGNPTDENIARYLTANGYVTDQDKLDSSKTTFILRIIVAIVMGVGLVICLLAFYILMLSVWLLVQKNSGKLENLLLIGYSPARVSRPYQLLTAGLNALVLLLALATMLLIRNTYLNMFTSFFPDMETPAIWSSVIVGAGLFIVVSLLGIIAVRSKIMSIWRHKN